MKSLIKSSVGKISTTTILLVSIIILILILKQAGIVRAQTENITGYEIVNNLTDNFTLNENVVTDENNNSIEITQDFNETLNETSGNISNETSEILNETIREIIESLGNQSIIIPNVSEMINETIEQKTINFEINLDYARKVTRGEIIKVKAIATNAGSSTAKNVVLDWKIPEGFEIVSGNQREFCGVVEMNSNCVSEVDIKTSISTVLGTSEIKVVVNYE